MNRAVAFLKGEALDNRGRSVGLYLQFDIDQWECSHDVIQWAFPTMEMSVFNPNAPVLDPNDREGMDDPIVLQNLDALLKSYLSSLGIVYTDGDFELHPQFYVVYSSWLQPHDHNYRRFSRVISCLREFGMQETAEKFFRFLAYRITLSHTSSVNSAAIVFWHAALVNEMHRIEK